MASLASGGETRSGVVWVCRFLVISLVAAITRGWQRRVIVVYVAQSAGGLCMRTGQWKAGGIVIERGRGPRACVVADLAGVRKADLSMIRRLG